MLKAVIDDRVYDANSHRNDSMFWIFSINPRIDISLNIIYSGYLYSFAKFIPRFPIVVVIIINIIRDDKRYVL